MHMKYIKKANMINNANEIYKVSEYIYTTKRIG